MMLPRPVRIFVKWRFNCQTPEQSVIKAKQLLAEYTSISQSMTEEQFHQVVTVRKSPGINENMNQWSLAHIMTHNSSVHELLHHNIFQLGTLQPVNFITRKQVHEKVLPNFNQEQPKKIDVTADFEGSIQNFIKLIEQDLKGFNLKQTATAPHMLFGSLTAHQWCGMYVFHLKVHLKQARAIQRKLVG